MAKATFNLPDNDLEQLRSLARRRNISITAALRQAIGTEVWIDEEIRNGNDIYLLNEKGETTKVKFLGRIM